MSTSFPKFLTWRKRRKKKREIDQIKRNPNRYKKGKKIKEMKLKIKRTHR